MQISFQVSRQAAILGGYNQSGLVTVDLDPATLGQDDRRLLAAAVTRDGRIGPSYPDADAPTVDGLLAMLRDKAARDEADSIQKQASADADIAAIAARAANNLRNRTTIDDCGKLYAASGSPVPYATERTLPIAIRGREAEITAWHSQEWAAWQAEIDAENARRDEALRAERAAKEAALAAKDAAEKAARAARKEKIREWAEANGSELTRARLAEGYDCWYSSAIDDIITTVGERFADAGLVKQNRTGGTAEQRKCPTLDEIGSLRLARNVAASINEWPTSVELFRVEYSPDDEYANYEDGDKAEPTYVTEICVDVDICGETETLWFLAE